MATDTFQRFRRALPVLLLLCGSVLAHTGGSWSPQCTKVSSGCTACKYVRQTRASTSARGLKQEAVSSTAAPVVTSSDITVQQAAPAVAVVQPLVAEPQATAASPGVPVSSSSEGNSDPVVPKHASSSYRQYSSSGSTRTNNGYTYSSSGSSSGRGSYGGYYSSSGRGSYSNYGGSKYGSSGAGGSSYGGYHSSSSGGSGSSYGSYQGSSSGGSSYGSYQGSSSWGGIISWGGSNYTWQPGASWSCTACDASRGYRLLTSTNGTQYCGCVDGHGVVARGSKTAAAQTAWASTHYVRSFTCQACGPNQVPFLPGSNVLVVWDGATWGMKCASSSSSGQNTQAPAVPPSNVELSSGLTTRRRRRAAAASAKSLPLATSTAAEAPGAVQLPPPAPPAVVTESGPVATSADSTVATQTAVSASGLQLPDTDFDSMHARQRQQQEDWYKRGRRRRSSSSSSSGGGTKYDCAPWLPGQCIDCSLVGATADPTGAYCMCGSGPTPTPPPSPRPSPSPSPPNPSPRPPSPSPSPPPSQACIVCDEPEIENEIAVLCPSNPTEYIYLADWCAFNDTISDVVFDTAPDVLDSTQEFYARDGAMLCSTLETKQNTSILVTATAIGTNLQCSPAITQTSFLVPTWGGTSPSPPPPSSPSPSPRPPSPSPTPPSPSPSPRPPSPSPIPPSPSPQPPSPSPSPPPSSTACVQCVFTQIIESITTNCGASLDDVFYFVMDQVPNEYCWWTDPAIGFPLFTTEPDIQWEPGTDVGDCRKAAGEKGNVITLTVEVNPDIDVGMTCTPTKSVYNFNMPNF